MQKLHCRDLTKDLYEVQMIRVEPRIDFNWVRLRMICNWHKNVKVGYGVPMYQQCTNGFIAVCCILDATPFMIIISSCRMR